MSKNISNKNMSEQELKEHLKALDIARKERHFVKKLANAPLIECGCGCKALIKSVDSYGRTKAYINGHNNKKYDDPKEYKRVYARKRYTDPLLKQRELEKKKQWHHKRKRMLIEFKGGQCMECGIKYDKTNGVIFQFHHRDPDTKVDRISFDWSWERVLKEAAKCDLLCSHCHAMIHCEPF